MCVRLILLFAVTCHCSCVFGEVEFVWTTVGDPGNEPDRTSSHPPKFYGGVDYEYRISKHEVTNEHMRSSWGTSPWTTRTSCSTQECGLREQALAAAIVTP